MTKFNKNSVVDQGLIVYGAENLAVDIINIESKARSLLLKFSSQKIRGIRSLDGSVCMQLETFDTFSFCIFYDKKYKNALQQVT